MSPSRGPTGKFFEHVLYGGSVTIRFYPKGHRYHRVMEDGSLGPRLTSVTAITGQLGKGDGLMYWAAEQAVKATASLAPNDLTRIRHWIDSGGSKDDRPDRATWARNAFKRYTKGAASVGSAVHTAIHNHVKKKPIGILDNEVVKAFEAFLDWKKSSGFVWTDSERLVYSPTHDYVGTVDLVGSGNDGVKTVIDWKTGNTYQDHYIQVALYARALTEEFPREPVGDRKVIGIHRDTGELNELCPRRSLETDIKIGLALLGIKRDLALKDGP